MPNPVDAIMDDATQALMSMEYLACEARCLEALALARQARDWSLYARVLLPLQECRRARRMTAAEGSVQLGTARGPADLLQWLRDHPVGCLLVTAPHTPEQARQALQVARRNQMYIEVLYASQRGDKQWTLRSFSGPTLGCPVAAPPVVWRDAVTTGQNKKNKPAAGELPSTTGIQPADWFIDATEAIGDEALRWVGPKRGVERIEALEQCLLAVTDHELLHQRLSDTARQLATGDR